MSLLTSVSMLLLHTTSLTLYTATTTLAQGSCTLATGVRGRCVEVRQCPTVLRTYRQSRPLVCVSPGEAKVVCCPASNLQLLQDISAPIVNFQCGQNIYQPFKLYTESVGPIRFLRPESINKTVLNKISSGDDPQRRPGVPLAALNDPKVFQLRPGPILGALRVLGGVTALKNNWPWMALLGEKNGKEIRWFYAGVLISDRWVLSALHCVLATTPHVVRLGEHDYNDDNDGAAHEDFSIVDIIPHPEYFHPQAYHDVVLLKLDHKVKLKPFINPVCLPWGRESSHSLVGQNVTLTGWGDTQFVGLPSSVLQQVNVTVFKSEECDKSYSTLLEYSDTWPLGIGEETVCAGDRNGGRDSCQGDSGGPIVYSNSTRGYILAGIVSRGYGCGLLDYPGLYVNIRHPLYLAWIKNVAF
ncbi:venom protease-like [Cherax quadricarinatus]|uniref:venom protease-like n=1 Tax=Cherax quadricarinatus TaxID=27406 RepID=UPI00387E582C